ncbi:hypothetical protein RN001_001083 [Aquatica leii]|uniref:Uncharacterized protein n=1 Tax=Aquatica leii TaxID=1421715 RepID=A0AAN7Q7M9_9COLE|nr:hypothetical protein RN001_001083 [Aquatica leii]
MEEADSINKLELLRDSLANKKPVVELEQYVDITIFLNNTTSEQVVFTSNPVARRLSFDKVDKENEIDNSDVDPDYEPDEDESNVNSIPITQNYVFKNGEIGQSVNVVAAESNENLNDDNVKTSADLNISNEDPVIEPTIDNRKILKKTNHLYKNFDRNKVLLPDLNEMLVTTTPSQITGVQITHGSKKDRKYLCIYCKKLYSRIAQHLQVTHKNEEAVKMAMTLSPGCLERKKIFETIRRHGDHMHNRSAEYNTGKLFVARRPRTVDSVQAEHIVACPSCKGQFRKTYLTRHYKNCQGGTSHTSIHVLSRSIRKDDDEEVEERKNEHKQNDEFGATDYTNGTPISHAVSRQKPVDQNFDEKLELETITSNNLESNKKRKHRPGVRRFSGPKSPWSHKEKNAVLKEFSDCFKSGSLPSYERMVKIISSNENLKLRSPQSIKLWIANQITKQKTQVNNNDTKNKAVTKQKWTALMKNTLFYVFKEHLQGSSLPSNSEIRKMQEKYPVFKNRSVGSIKVAVDNERRRLQRGKSFSYTEIDGLRGHEDLSISLPNRHTHTKDSFNIPATTLVHMSSTEENLMSVSETNLVETRSNNDTIDAASPITSVAEIVFPTVINWSTHSNHSSGARFSPSSPSDSFTTLYSLDATTSTNKINENKTLEMLSETSVDMSFENDIVSVTEANTQYDNHDYQFSTLSMDGSPCNDLLIINNEDAHNSPNNHLEDCNTALPDTLISVVVDTLQNETNHCIQFEGSKGDNNISHDDDSSRGNNQSITRDDSENLDDDKESTSSSHSDEETNSLEGSEFNNNEDVLSTEVGEAREKAILTPVHSSDSLQLNHNSSASSYNESSSADDYIPSKKKSKHVSGLQRVCGPKRSWTPGERKAASEHFGKYLLSNKLPSIAKICQKLPHITALNQRSPTSVKTWLYNEMVRKKGRQHLTQTPQSSGNSTATIVRTRWTQSMKSELKRVFANHIKCRKLPSNAECATAKDNFPDFQHLTVAAIKTAVANQLQRMHNF